MSIEPFEEGTVRGFLHRPEQPDGNGIVLTHGAGSNCQAPLLVAVAREFAAAGLIVLRCDLPYRQARPSGPPSPGGAALDREGLRAAVAAVRRIAAGRVYLGGHSYGGRQASMLAAADPGVTEALLLLSYPLHPPRKPTELRTAHFPKLVYAGRFRARIAGSVRNARGDAIRAGFDSGAVGAARDRRRGARFEGRTRRRER